MGPACSYSCLSSELSLTVFADENEGLEAPTVPDYESQVGNGGREE